MEMRDSKWLTDPGRPQIIQNKQRVMAANPTEQERHVNTTNRNPKHFQNIQNTQNSLLAVLKPSHLVLSPLAIVPYIAVVLRPSETTKVLGHRMRGRVWHTARARP